MTAAFTGGRFGIWGPFRTRVVPQRLFTESPLDSSLTRY
jgi:hypothetical protein